MDGDSKREAVRNIKYKLEKCFPQFLFLNRPPIGQ